MKLSEVVGIVEGQLVSDGEFETLNYCTAEIEESFLSFIEKEKFIPKMNQNITCILCTKELVEKLPSHIKGIYVVEEPKFCFHKIYEVIELPSNRKSFKTIIGENCRISPNASIPENNVLIGDNVIIEDFVKVYENVTIKDNCILRAHTTIGGRSFSPARSKSGEVCALVDRGQVVLEKGVEILSQTHVAQGIWPTDVTYIGENSRIDVQTHIGHDATIGKAVFIAAGSIIGGSSQLGDNVWIGINAAVSNRVKVGDGARVSLGSVVTKDVESGKTVTGNFAIDHSLFIEQLKKKV